MPSFFDPRKTPVSVKVYVSTGLGVDIEWGDGHTSHYDFAYLREHCPCATCTDAHGTGQSTKPSAASPLPGMGPSLPMFKPKLSARQAKAVGQYAIQIEFNDGHATGIYSFDYLRAQCPCEACARDFRTEMRAEPHKHQEI